MQKKTFIEVLEKGLTFLGLFVFGSLFSRFAITFGGLDLFLAGVVFVMMIDAFFTLNMSAKWGGLICHLLWAAALCLQVYEFGGLEVDVSCWQWDLLWVVLGVRLIILQPIYVIQIRKGKKFF